MSSCSEPTRQLYIFLSKEKKNFVLPKCDTPISLKAYKNETLNSEQGQSFMTGPRRIAILKIFPSETNSLSVGFREGKTSDFACLKARANKMCLRGCLSSQFLVFNLSYLVPKGTMELADNKESRWDLDVHHVSESKPLNYLLSYKCICVHEMVLCTASSEQAEWSSLLFEIASPPVTIQGIWKKVDGWSQLLKSY